MNKQLLQSKIVQYDGTQKHLADAMGLSLSRLNAKLNGKAEFTQGEIGFITSRYKLNKTAVMDIFFNDLIS